MGDKKYGAVIERLREGTKAYEDFTNQMAPPPEGDEPSIWEKLFMPFSSKVRAWDRLQMPTIPSDVVTPPEPTQLPQVAEQPPSDLDKFLSMFGLGKEGQKVQARLGKGIEEVGKGYETFTETMRETPAFKKIAEVTEPLKPVGEILTSEPALQATMLIPPLMGFAAGGKFAKELWNAMKIAERNALAKQAGLEGKVGSKAFEKLSASEKTALGKVAPKGEGVKPIPPTEVVKPPDLAVKVGKGIYPPYRTVTTPEASYSGHKVNKDWLLSVKKADGTTDARWMESKRELDDFLSAREVKPPAVEAPLVKEGAGVVPPVKLEVAKPTIGATGKFMLPEPPRVPDEYMAFARKEVAGSFKGKKGVFDTIEQARQQVLKSRDVGGNTVPYVMSYVREAGDIGKEFGIKGGLATKVVNPQGRSLAINDVLSNYTHYKLTPTQLEIAKRQGEVYKEALKLAKSYDVKIAELGGPDEFWQFIARRVKGKLNPMTGEYEMPKTGVGGFRMGAKISAQKERVFEQMSEGLDLGFLYENPDQVMASHIRGIYRLIGNKQAEKMVKPLTRQITKEAPLKFGERAIGEPALRARAANQEVANAIDKIFTPEVTSKALRISSDINRALVGQIAALDVSAPFIQGLPLLGHDIKMGLKGKPSFVWARAYGNMWKTVFKPESINKFRTQNAELYKRYIEVGGMTGQSEFVSGVGVAERGLGKLPLAGKPLKEVYRQLWGRMGQAYSDFLEIAKVRFFEQMEPVWLREGENIYSLGAIMNRMAGATSAAARGVSANRRLLEGTLAFAPNYLRSSLLMIKDLMSRGATAREVQASIAALLGTGAAIYYAEEKIRGREPKLKPWPKRLGGDGADAFTTVIGNTRVGVGSWMYGMIKMLAEIGAVAVDDPSALIVWNQAHPVVRFVKTKTGPMISLASELATGRNFWGQPFNAPQDYLMRIVESLAPIATQSWITQEPKGEPAQIGAELMGLRSFPYTLKSRWTDEGVFKEYDAIPTNVLERKEQGIKLSRDMYRTRNPDVDAKLFITGQVSSIQTPKALQEVLKLVEENRIDPKSIRVVEKWDAEKNARRLKTGFKDTLTDRLIKELLK